MLSLQKSAFDRTSLGYDFSTFNIASSSKISFVSSANDNNVENNDVNSVLASENLDKDKSILGVPPKVAKKETKKSQQRKPHFCHHCGATGHIRLNCYKWLATQQSNNIISPGN